jgi:hypothetical protein
MARPASARAGRGGRAAEWLTLALLGTWGSASVLAQLPIERIQRLRRWDLPGLLPQWSFFAPRPGMHDYHLLYRDQLDERTFTDWTELSLDRPLAWWCALWNPERRQRKAIYDLVTSLVRDVAQAEGVGYQLSVPYLAILNHISSLERLSAHVGTQFMIMMSDGADSDQVPEPVFVSTVHRV